MSGDEDLDRVEESMDRVMDEEGDVSRPDLPPLAPRAQRGLVLPWRERSLVSSVQTKESGRPFGVSDDGISNVRVEARPAW